MKPITVLAFIVLALSMPHLAIGQITADDFLPPVLGGSNQVKAPEKVAVNEEKKELTASNAQDAMNAATQKTREVAKSDNVQVGGMTIRFPSGLGFVATGAGTYREMANPTASRIAKRQAYVMAYTAAKRHLAESLNGLSTEGREEIRQALHNVNLPDEEMTNISTQSEASLKQSVEMMLRGFVVYEVKDDSKANTVYVTIVTTPKTRGNMSRLGPAAAEIDNIRDGLNQVIAEVKSGIVPPVGGRVLIVSDTGETAFVGFGSHIVRTSENSAAQAKLNLSAIKIARAHAQDALCGLLIGDETSWRGQIEESQRDEYQEFDEIAEKDPLSGEDSMTRKKLDRARETFVAEIKTTDVYESARKGVLPPGVTTKTWFDENHAWAYAMSVYIPSHSDAARQAADEMRNADLVKGKGEPSEGQQGFTDTEDTDVPSPSKEVKPGPTGKVSSDEEL